MRNSDFALKGTRRVPTLEGQSISSPQTRTELYCRHARNSQTKIEGGVSSLTKLMKGFSNREDLSLEERGYERQRGLMRLVQKKTEKKKMLVMKKEDRLRVKKVPTHNPI